MINRVRPHEGIRAGAEAQKRETRRGKNLLGEILAKIREEILGEY